MNRPRASVIITTYNRPEGVVRAIESAFKAGQDLEVIVVDDASDETTVAACSRFPEARYVRVDRNQGVAGARNIGLAVSRGEYLTFLDDDDARLPGSLDRQIEILDQQPDVGFVYGQAIVEGQDGSFRKMPRPLDCPQGDIFWRLLTHNFIPCGSVVFRRTCLSSVGLLDHRVAGPDDWDLWVRLSEMFYAAAVREPVVIWRRSTPASGQGTSEANQMVAFGVQQFWRWMSLPRVQELPRRAQRKLWRGFSERMIEHLGWQSIRAVRYGRIAQAGKNFLTLRRLYPPAFASVLKSRFSRSTWRDVRNELYFDR
jgi:glycosyltransferase involved in cell wall biosynthesis